MAKTLHFELKHTEDQIFPALTDCGFSECFHLSGVICTMWKIASISQDSTEPEDIIWLNNGYKVLSKISGTWQVPKIEIII